MKDTKFAVIGGDMRQVKFAELLARDGYSVSTYAIDRAAIEGALPAATLEEAVKDAGCVALPLPITVKEDILNAPLSKGVHMIGTVFTALSPGQIICAGRIPGDIYELAAKKGLSLLDYYAREELIVSNAVATAEGAIQIAMEETPITICGCRCMVIGFGRIGKILAHRLLGLGAHVVVSARKYSDLAWIKAYGYEAVDTGKLEEKLPGCNVVFNTVPARILGEDRMKEIDKDCLCIDLSSKPGGMDFIAASKLGINVIWALSLPGEVAPVTSGKIIRDTIYNILHEHGGG